MPKRSAIYMDGQRELIARATLEVLMENGIYNASLRSICSRAGVSFGAFYNLFPTKEDAIVAARYLDLTESEMKRLPPVSDWQSYVANIIASFCGREEKDLRRRRISLQFAAELLMMEKAPEGAPVLLDVQRSQMAANLASVLERGEISLPLGLDRTVEIHAQLGLGASYRLSNDRTFSVAEILAALEDGLAATAGLIERTRVSRASARVAGESGNDGHRGEAHRLPRDWGEGEIPKTDGNLLERLQDRLPEFQALRRDIHQHPETAFEETRTAEIVAGELRRHGLEVVTGIAETGVVGILRAGSSDRAIGLRADMDALDVEELNSFEHRSVRPGKMHACGHDGHTATLLAAAAYLAEHRDFDGTVYFIFQPAEEGDGGAKRMIEEGLFERFPMQAVFGLHNMPGLPVGSFAVRPGPMLAGVDEFRIVIEGAGGHGAMPHLASDPIVAATALVQSLQTILTRNKNPLQAAVLSITSIHGGSAANVIPNRVELLGTVRYFEQSVQALIEQRMRHIVSHVAEAHGCAGSLRYDKLFPPTVNAPEEAVLCGEVLRSLVGADNVNTDPQPLMGSEDFSFMLEAKPGCYILAGNGDDDGGCTVHSPYYDFNDRMIPFGAAYWVRLVATALGRTSQGQPD